MSTDLKTSVASIKAAYVISDYIKGAGVSLTASGAGKWKGLCPFHNEKSPSFTVSDHFQNFRCWGCGASGDLMKFVMDTEHLEFMDALRKLADDKGIELEVSNSSDPAVDYRSLRECLREAANFFLAEYRKLDPTHVARKQVTDRGLSEKKMLYGYAPEKRTALYEHLKAKGFSNEVMIQAGVVSEWKDSGKISDFWSGRLMFIITDVTGKPIGFSGRILFTDQDKRGKFVNSSAGPLFDKSSALFGISGAKDPAAKSKTVYVAEGQFDVSAFVEADLLNTVASSGTAFTQQQGAILQRLVGDAGKVVFAFDGDQPGVDAALKVFKNVPSLHSTALVVQFPQGEDPCDFRLARGNEALRELVEKAVPLVGFVLDANKKKYDLTNEVGRSQYLEYACRVLATISSNSLRETFLRRVTLETFSELDTVRELVKNSDPVELGYQPPEEEKVASARPDELQDTVSVDLLELIDRSERHRLAARFLALMLLDRTLVQHLEKAGGRLPKEFHSFAKQLRAYPEERPIIPEAFDESDLVVYLSNAELFPQAHLPLFDARAQLNYVFKRYAEATQRAKEQYVQAKIHSILAASPNSGVELLEEALAQEESYLKAGPNA